METEFWAYQYAENPPKDEVEDEDFDVDAEVAAMADDDWKTEFE